MLFTIADPSPANQIHEKLNAFGGKSNASFASKCRIPPQMSQTIVPTTPIHNRTEILPMVVIRRYSRKAMKTTKPPEMNFPCRVVSGYRYPAYLANPIEAEATESGACTSVCQTNKNDISRPHFSGRSEERRVGQES